MLSFTVAGALASVAEADAPQRAARALRMDPGALVGGNTQVTAAPGQRLVGVALRPNFMLA